MDLEQEILEIALDKFTRFGISAVSMEDIAKASGIGKTKLYAIFPSKDILLDKVMELLTQKWDGLIAEVLKEPLNPLQKIITLQCRAISEIQHVQPVFLHDLRKRYTHSYASYEGYKTHFVFKVVYSLMKEARDKGMLIASTDIQAVCELLFFQVESIVRDKLSEGKGFSALQVVEQLVIPHLRGIVLPEYIPSITTKFL